MTATGCASPSETPDGDLPDGDVSDGDITDGDTDEDGDTDTDEEKPYDYPDSSFIHEIRQQDAAQADSAYEQELVEQLVTTAQLPNLDVRDVLSLSDSTLVATAGGVYRITTVENTSSPQAIAGIQDEVAFDLAAVVNPGAGVPSVLAATEAAIYAIDPTDNSTDRYEVTFGAPTAVAGYSTIIIAGTANGAWIISTGDEAPAWTALAELENKTVNTLAINSDGILLTGTTVGVITIDLVGSAQSETWTAENLQLPDDNVRSIAVSDCLTVIACETGFSTLTGNGFSIQKPGEESAPTANNLSVAIDASGILLGHTIGATFLPLTDSCELAGGKTYYQSGRWIPNNRVNGVALQNGQRWLATSSGLSRIYPVLRTLGDKEAVFDAAVPDFWRMDGFFMSDASTPNGPWEPDSMVVPYDKDNDGLWTQMMIGGWCFAYSVTGDERFYNYARKAMDNMFLLQDVPAKAFEDEGMEPGFIARSLIRADETDNFAGKVTAAEKVDGKEILRWREIEYNGETYLWKGDTSSDEYAGHFFGFPVFYDLCAKTDEERQTVAGYAERAVDYIINGGFKLLDIDGTRTLHGHWDPDTISIGLNGLDACMADGYDIMDCLESMHGGGWLNSLEMMGMLLATWHMTGEPRFYDAYEMLIRTYHYDEVAMANDETYTITRPTVANHSDHELAMLAYTTIIRYEPNAERRAKWIKSLEFLYEHELPERNPWWAGICALSGCSNPGADIASALDTLQQFPDDRRKWYINQGHRKDKVDLEKDRHGSAQIDRVFPYGEIRAMWWNGNPYETEWGGDGRDRYCPTAWLLPYYMNLYAGSILAD
jgi:hypothetical protein